MTPETPATCDLYDQYKERARIPAAGLADYGGREAFAGMAVTVKCFEDNSRIKELSATPGKGKVLVVDAGGSTRCAVMGDMIAGDFARNGWEGVIIDGCVRDVAALADLPLGIKALGHLPRASIRRNEGTVGLTIVIGGAACAPGDQVIADADGIVFLDAGTHP